MRSRRFIWIVLCLLCVAGAWLFWRLENRPAGKSAAPDHFSYTAPRPVLPGQLPAGNQPVPAQVTAALATNAFALRLSNTPKSIGELVNDPHAILLENALIDTRSPLDFSIPKHLQAQGDPGAYIVQARGPVTAAFRAALARAGAEIVSYIPNDAYLVRVGAGGAGGLAADPLTQSVIPYEPYYKIQSSLLDAAVGQELLPDGAVLNLGLFASGAPQTIQEIEKLGGKILAQDRSPFGPLLRVQPPQNWTALAALPGVQIVEAFHPRVHANDLSRVSTGVSSDTITNVNYLGLDGHNVIVQVNDSGIDATHPDFATGRVLGFTTNDIVDTDGHGTFVAGEIAGNGSASKSPTAVGAVLAAHNFGSVSNADFRGKAPLATLFAMNKDYSDQSLQEEAALTNALISNNSWNFDGDNSYSLESASFDAATRDALPEVTGSQPVLFVFAAGNAGNGDNSHDPGGGNANSIESPATAKNVITVGAIQELRNITNSVTNFNGLASTPWQPETSTSYRIAGFSSRGNVGIGIEGTYGRFKPDVVAPGTFIVSTRSAQWDAYDYFYQNPTNYATQTFTGVTVGSHARRTAGFPIVPTNAVAVSIVTTPNANSPGLYPSPVSLMPIYFAFIGSPFPGSTFTTSGSVYVPSDGGWSIAQILSSEHIVGFSYAFSNLSSGPIEFDYTTTIVTTNGQGNQNLVYSNLDNTLGPYYRFESGTSMSAADVSGVLALMADFFTNTLHQTPSPALLKAMLINGARPTGAYNLQVNNAINYEGWGMVNLPNSLPTNTPASYNGSGTAPSSIFIQDQSPTNALATGDNQVFTVTIQTNNTPLRVTLAWTDPPGNPAAAIKLVNSLELVVTNMDDPTNPVVYYGNDIPAGGTFNTAESASNSLSPDAINNVQNVILPQPLGTNYTVTVIGREVNVNAVSAQTNSYAINLPSPSPAVAPNVVQDYALVISSGDSGTPGSFTVVTPAGIVSNPTGDQNITFVTTTNQPLLNQFVGANTPLLGTNTVGLGTNTPWSSSGQLTVGMTNQWHFYVVTNNGPAADYTNAGFVTLTPPTLSIPREGVFADSQANATRPQADIDLFVTTDPSLTNLSPAALANCLLGGQIGVSAPPGPGGVFNGASLTRAGTEFVVDNGGSQPGEVYYIGVKSEAQTASEFTFVPIFSNIPFSQTNQNGDEIVNGMLVPFDIPDGTPANPGVGFSIGLAIYPITVADITVTNVITHQNFGDLYGTLTHSDNASGLDTVDVLNNHSAWGTVFDQMFIYNETNIASGGNPPDPLVPIIRPSDGPGSLKLYDGQDGSGVWRMTEVDDSLTQTGSVQNFSMFIRRHRDLLGGSTNTIPPHTMFYDFVDVPAGATNLTISATNVSTAAEGGADLANPMLMVIKFGSQPTLGNADKGPVPLNNGTPPGNSLSVGPTDVPPIQPGRYWVGITNQSDNPQDVFVIAVILPPNPSATTTDFASTGSTPLLDDAVTYSDIFVETNLPIVSLNVGIRVDHPRISDMVFHLIGPDGTRVLLMENRGGDTANAGITVIVTNVVNASAGGNGTANTNYVDVGETSGTLPITYNFYTVPDEMTVYYGTNVVPSMLILDTGFTNNPPSGGGGAQSTQPETLTVNFGPTNGVSSTFLTIVMNQFGAYNGGGPNSTAWTYTGGGVFTNYYYLLFTEDTNLTTTPIKYAVPPFVPVTQTNYVVQTNVTFTVDTNSIGTNSDFSTGFESVAAGDYASSSSVTNWTVTANQVSVVTDPADAYEGTNFLALASGVISNTLPTVADQSYTLTFAYRGPDIEAMWRAESNALENIGANNGTLVNGANYTNGEVGTAFNLPGVDPNQTSTHFSVGPGPEVQVPYSSYWNFGSSSFTIDLWANFNVVPSNLGFGIGYPYDGIFISDDGGFGGNNKWWFAQDGPVLDFHINDMVLGADFTVQAPFTPQVHQWYHFAITRNGNLFTIYTNGVVNYSVTDTRVIPNPSVPLEIGGGEGFYFNGALDETSIYGRALSASEIKAIYDKGTNGKFDPVVFNTSPAQSLAEAQVSLNGLTVTNILGNNTAWQTQTITFTATSNGTPFQITGLEPGMLVDAFVMTTNSIIAVTNVFTNVIVTASNLCYLPEQSLSVFTGKNPHGYWQLESQDDRAGAFDPGNPPALLSWELQFVFANTNPVPTSLNGGIGQSNQFIPANSIAWYQISVPADATIATNLLLFASAPVNVWFSTNAPPTIINSGDTNLIPNSTGNTNSPAILYTNTASSPFIVPGDTYYLGVQNTNSVTVNYGIKVNFFNGSTNEFSSLTLSSISESGGGTTLKWTASPGAQFEVQWKDDLTQPWNTDSNVITSGDGNFTFTDNGSQTAPLGPMRFYRLVQISP